MAPDKRAHVPNQIGRFFQTRKHDSAVEAISNHLVKFWDKRMRREIIGQAQAKDGQLDPLVRESVERLASRSRT